MCGLHDKHAAFTVLNRRAKGHMEVRKRSRITLFQ
jgi:hypothetical protein